jgi:hypothetical protein
MPAEVFIDQDEFGREIVHIEDHGRNCLAAKLAERFDAM